MNDILLRERVYSLASRFPALGIGPDICALTVRELWGLYRFLRRYSEAAA